MGGLLGVLLLPVALLARALPHRTPPPAPPAVPLPHGAARPSRAVQGWRIGLVAAGALLIGVAGGLFSAGVPARQWGAVLLWLAGAVVLHDALLSPALLVLARLLRAAGGRLPWAAIGVVEVALVVGGALTLIAIPGIAAQAIGNPNSTVLVFPYALHLAVAWAVLGAIAVVGVVLLVLRARRPAVRIPAPPAVQRIGPTEP